MSVIYIDTKRLLGILPNYSTDDILVEWVSEQASKGSERIKISLYSSTSKDWQFESPFDDIIRESLTEQEFLKICKAMSIDSHLSIETKDFVNAYDRYIRKAEKKEVPRVHYSDYNKIKEWKIKESATVKVVELYIDCLKLDYNIKTPNIIPGELFDELVKESIWYKKIYGKPDTTRENEYSCGNATYKIKHEGNVETTQSLTASKSTSIDNFYTSTYGISSINTTKPSIDFCVDLDKYKIESNTITDNIQTNKLKEKSKNEKEKTTMKTNFNFDFGPVKGGIKFSPFGLAIANKDGDYVVFKDGAIVDTMGITFDINGMAYKMPVAIKDIKVNDLIMHQGKPVYVTGVKGNDIEVVDIYDGGEKKTFIPTTNTFGFNFATKVVSFINMDNMAPNGDNPFGNILPFMLFADGDKNFLSGDSNGNDMLKFFALSSMMNGGTNPFAMFNPTPADKKAE